MPGCSFFLNTRANDDAQTVECGGAEVSFDRRAALAAEMLENLSGISKYHCLLHRRRARISRRHIASSIQSGHRPDIQLVS